MDFDFGTFLSGPLAQYVFIASAIMITLVLFGTIKFELRRELVAAQLRSASLEIRLAELEEKAQTLKNESAALPVNLPVAEMAFSGVNLTKRTQALRLHRQGSDPEVIARNLGVAKGEVNLMLKLHRIIVDTANEGKKA